MRIVARNDLDHSPMLAVLVAEGDKPDLPRELAGTIALAVKRGDFNGKFRETMLLYGEGKADRVLLVGLGKKKKIEGETLRRVSAVVEKKAQALKLKRYTLLVPRLRFTGLQLGQWLAEGAVLASYRYAAKRRERAEDASTPPEQLTLLADADLKLLEAGVRRGVAVATATNLARDLCNAPANVATPSYLGEQA